jgi:hypothetical protein
MVLPGVFEQPLGRYGGLCRSRYRVVDEKLKRNARRFRSIRPRARPHRHHSPVFVAGGVGMVVFAGLATALWMKG